MANAGSFVRKVSFLHKQEKLPKFKQDFKIRDQILRILLI